MQQEQDYKLVDLEELREAFMRAWAANDPGTEPDDVWDELVVELKAPGSC
ncbi:hypothetical protein ACFOW6_09435 [Fodinicurvata halophila]|uniref:Uncharacterized protein n=1 Tax=Fodinicurvata halophila TaxID=1419723 RepID=A0ABV8ULZ7_9PROT